MFYQLALYEAPVIDTADPLRHGYGADVLAFRFNRNGVLIAPPAYVAQELPNVAKTSDGESEGTILSEDFLPRVPGRENR